MEATAQNERAFVNRLSLGGREKHSANDSDSIDTCHPLTHTHLTCFCFGRSSSSCYYYHKSLLLGGGREAKVSIAQKQKNLLSPPLPLSTSSIRPHSLITGCHECLTVPYKYKTDTSQIIANLAGFCEGAGSDFGESYTELPPSEALAEGDQVTSENLHGDGRISASKNNGLTLKGLRKVLGVYR